MANPTRPHHEPRTHIGASAHDEQQHLSQPTPHESQASDLNIAKAISKAVRATPGVVDLSPGLFALAATYGANEQFVGIVVRKSSLLETVVEVHVIVAIEVTPNVEEQGNTSSVSAQMETSDSAVLIRVANRVRKAVYRAMEDLRLAPPASVDIFIDDIQEPV